MPNTIDKMLAEVLALQEEAKSKRQARKLRDRLMEPSESMLRKVKGSPKTNQERAISILQEAAYNADNRKWADTDTIPKRLKDTERKRPARRDTIPFPITEEEVEHNRKANAKFKKELKELRPENRKIEKGNESKLFEKKRARSEDVYRINRRGKRLADLKRAKGIRRKEWNKMVEFAKDTKGKNPNKSKSYLEDMLTKYFKEEVVAKQGEHKILNDLDELDRVGGKNTGSMGHGGLRRASKMFLPLSVMSTIVDIVNGDIEEEDVLSYIPFLSEAEPIGIGGKLEKQRDSIENPDITSIADLRKLARQRLGE